MFEIIVKVYQSEILIERPCRSSALRIDRYTNNAYAEKYSDKEQGFHITICGKLNRPIEEFSLSNLRELYHDFVGMEAE